jgi:hypothetical protein
MVEDDPSATSRRCFGIPLAGLVLRYAGWHNLPLSFTGACTTGALMTRTGPRYSWAGHNGTIGR